MEELKGSCRFARYGDDTHGTRRRKGNLASPLITGKFNHIILPLDTVMVNVNVKGGLMLINFTFLASEDKCTRMIQNQTKSKPKVVAMSRWSLSCLSSFYATFAGTQ